MVTAIIEVTTSIILSNGVAGDEESTEKTVENDGKAWGMPPFANSNLVNLTEDEYLEVVINMDRCIVSMNDVNFLISLLFSLQKFIEF